MQLAAARPTLSVITVPSGMRAQGVDGYNGKKPAFHADAKKFLREVAKVLGMPAGTYSVTSNPAGPAICGEVMLHSDDLYVQVSECGRGAEVLFRSCESRKDYSGHGNNFARLDDLVTPERQMRVLGAMRRLIDAEQARKQAAVVSASGAAPAAAAEAPRQSPGWFTHSAPAVQDAVIEAVKAAATPARRRARP